MEGLAKYADITQFTIVNNFTFIFVPYNFGFDYAKGDRDNRHRLDECISELWKNLIKMGFTEVKMSKDGAIKAKTFDANGDIEKYWRITIFRDTFEGKPAKPESSGMPPLPGKLERTDTTGGGLQRYDTITGTLPPRKPFGFQRFENECTESGPAAPPILQREFSSRGEPVMNEVAPVPHPMKLGRTESGPVPQPMKLGRTESGPAPPTLFRECSSSGATVPQPMKLGRTESVCSPAPPRLQRQITSSANVGFMKDLNVLTPQKSVQFEDPVENIDETGVITEHNEPECDPQGLVLNVWKLTGEGFEFYDMFEEFKGEIMKWKR